MTDNRPHTEILIVPLVTASQTSSTPTKARSSPAKPSPARLSATASPSASTARGLGATTCSSSGCGAASNTRRSICAPTTASARPAPRSAATSSSTIGVGRMRALTAQHPIKPTSLRCRSARQPNLGRGSTYRCGKSVQTTGTTSQLVHAEAGPETVDRAIACRICDGPLGAREGQFVLKYFLSREGGHRPRYLTS